MFTSDPRLAAIYETGRCDGVPAHIAYAAHWLLELMRPIREWSTLQAIASVTKGTGGRHFASIDPNWSISFEWDYDCCCIKNPVLEG
jgi:hypothetical protein